MTEAERTGPVKTDDWAAAEAFYETELLPELLSTQKGKVLVLDLVSRDYAIGANLTEADSKLKEQHPGSYGYAFRIGYRTVGSLGGGRIREIEA